MKTNNAMEHFTFLLRLFDFSDAKVQMAAAGGLIASFFTLLCSVFTGASFSIGIPVLMLFVICLIMIVDLITGLWAANKEKVNLTSKRGLGWPIKFFVYLMLIMMMTALIQHTITAGILWLAPIFQCMKVYIIVHVCYWETKSIDENLIRLGYKVQILRVIDSLLKGILSTIKSKINTK